MPPVTTIYPSVGARESTIIGGPIAPSPFGRSLIDDADAAEARGTLGITNAFVVNAVEAGLGADAGAQAAIAAAIVDDLPKSINPAMAYKLTIKGQIPFSPSDAADQLTLLGTSAAPYPQGFTVDWQTRELFVIRTSEFKSIVEVYNWDTLAYVSCFRLDTATDTPAGKTSESIVIRRIGGSRYLYANSAVNFLHRYDITTLPANLTALVADASYEIGVNLSFAWDGREWIVEDRAAPLSGDNRRHRYIRYDDTFTRIGDLDLGLMHAGAGTGIYSNTGIPKQQGFTVGHGGFWLGIGGRRSTEGHFGYRNQGVRFFSGSGALLLDALFHEPTMAAILAANGVPSDFVENEGILVSPEGEVFTLSVTTNTGSPALVGGIVFLKHFAREATAIDFSAAQTRWTTPSVERLQSGLFPRSTGGKMYNPVTGAEFVSWDDIIEFMQAVDMAEFSYYTSSVTILDAVGGSLPTARKVTLHNLNNSTTFVTVFGFNFSQVYRVLGGVGARTQLNISQVIKGVGSPEGVVSANVGTAYLDDAGSADAILYVKGTGTGNTGWVLLQTANFTQSGTGAVSRTMLDKLREVATPEDFGAVGDGVTDDSAAFTLALAASRRVQARRGSTYLIKDIVISGRSVDMSGAITRAAPDALWMFRLEGFRPELVNVEVEDVTAEQRLMRSSTLASGASAAATTLTVADSAGFAVRMTCVVELDDRTWHTALITGISGNDLTLEHALPSDAASGRRVRATHGAIWIGDSALYFKVDNILLKATPGGIVAKGTTGSVTAGGRGSVSNVRGYGNRIFATALYGNSYDIDWSDILFFNGYNVTANYTGDGVTTDFAAPEAIFRVGSSGQATVRVNGVAQAYTSGWTLPTTQTNVRLASAPAAGVTVQITVSTWAARGRIIDQATRTTTSGGHTWDRVRMLECFVGSHFRSAIGHIHSQSFDDTCYDGLRLQGTTTRLTFYGQQSLFNYNASIHATDSQDVRFLGGLVTSRMDVGDKYSGVLGENIFVDTGTTISLDRTAWVGPSFGISGGGVIRQTAATSLPFVLLGGTQVQIDPVTDAVNYLRLRGNTSGFGPTLGVEGPDSNIPLVVGSKGSGIVYVNSPTGTVRVQYGGSDRMIVGNTQVQSEVPFRLPTYTVATLPAAGSFGRCMVYVSDGTSDKRLAISDSVNWRWPDGAIVS
jgi:hypothetical protein